MDEFVTLVSNVGFPIAVASYLLIRLEPIVKDFQKSISGLTLVIAKQNEVTQEQVNQLMDIVQSESK
ncbi:YvrJ-like protein [Sinobaca qinghaiensis]|uniref:YvrJ-like protein n=1 Tax=Sinobaca qinghaiensis TaxID=342944 RepID=A0A419V0D2_9BACL|nr:YvrJ family protein [Sinobaca qinghaiensis]RKD71395.1 YvrJ-like protein [Sinobaca qinghaiensis]